MIWHLVKKEVLNKIIDFRFLVSSLIGLCLIVLTTVILSEQYMKQVQQYNEFVTSDRQALNNVKCFSQLRLIAHYPPNPLWIFSKGVNGQTDRSVSSEHDLVPRQGLEISSENPFMSIFSFFDLSTIFLILLSLLAILMVYDSVSGERSSGTLKATLSHPVARYQIILSKGLAAFISLLIPLILGLLVSLLIMTIYSITFSAVQWLSILLLVIFTLLFLGTFIAGGLLVSSLTRQPFISLIWLLFLWIAGVFIQPNIGGYIASSVVTIPSRMTIETDIRQKSVELQQKATQIYDEIDQEVPGDPWHSDHSSGWPFYSCFDGNRVGLYRYVLRTQRIQPLFVENADEIWHYYQENVLKPLKKQASLQDLIDLVSPAALYQKVASLLSETAVQNHDDFMDQARQYRRSYLTYLIDERKVFSDNANLYFTQQTMEQIQNSDYMERIEHANRTGQTFVSYGSDYFGPLNLEGLPQFQFHPAPLARTLRAILIDILILALLPLLLFYLSVVAFNRYDVRSE